MSQNIQGERVAGNGTETASVTGATAQRAGHEYLLSADSEQQPTLSVVMPTLDEEGGIGECIGRICDALAELGLYGEIIVSDSSSDRTPEIAQELGAIVVEPDRSGYGYAYRYAFRHARGEYIAIGDADTTYDFAELPKLYWPVANGEADMVLGSRLAGEILPGAMPPLHQYVGNPLLTKFLNVFYDAGVSDAHSGMRVISREALDLLDLQTDGMEFASEMIMRAAEVGLRIDERPITYHPRTGEATLESFRDGWRHIRFMLVHAPGYLFTGPSLALGGIGFLMMCISLFEVALGGVFFGTHTMILGSLLTIVAYQGISLSMFSTVVGDPIRKPRDPVTAWIDSRFSLEHGATLGVTVLGIGLTYAGMLTWRWIATGYTQPPFVPMTMLAFTAIILGIQTVFYSFFLSMLAQRRYR